ncbi:MAG: 1-acyl-sn-glycerol-3-phosphate acyltransferase [Lachnospiraceae bacterium]|nr:1-acyl-sn-glycerol-3-phosphate acyltransferase [Lachnospiraceae bacterium]
MKNRKTVYYKTYDEDIVRSRSQDLQLPPGYQRYHKNPVYCAVSSLIYAVFAPFALLYVKLVLHVKTVNRHVLRECRNTGYFLYGNHTQPIGDAFAPGLYVAPKRIRTIAAPSNLGIPMLGKILPMLGALIIPDSPGDMKDFLTAMGKYLEQRDCIVIYPEAHVWPWCTFIRPFPETAFRFPVRFHAPCFCMTTTYQKPKRGKKPRITVYFDGPFYADASLKPKEAQRRLHDELAACMALRSKNSNYEYIHYEKRDPT